jgi:hypothetical protein
MLVNRGMFRRTKSCGFGVKAEITGIRFFALSFIVPMKRQLTKIGMGFVFSDAAPRCAYAATGLVRWSADGAAFRIA